MIFWQILLSLFVIKINLREPLSSLFKSITACPVVPLPAKKSRIIESFSLAALINSLISFIGLGVANAVLSPNKAAISSFAEEVVPRKSITVSRGFSRSTTLPFCSVGCIIVRELSGENFTHINVVCDTTKFDKTKNLSPTLAYNYVCRILIERVSWFMRDTNREGDILLSSRGTSRDGELIDYIKNKLFPDKNEVYSDVFKKVSAKSSFEWDLLQLADVCATSMFLSHEINRFNLYYPCFASALSSHLYKYKKKYYGYGLKYMSNDMRPDVSELKKHAPCTKKERTPSATTT